MKPSLAVINTPVETGAQRAVRLQAEAKAAAAEHLQAFEESALVTAGLADELEGMDLIPFGARDTAEKLAKRIRDDLTTIQAAMQATSRRPVQ